MRIDIVVQSRHSSSYAAYRGSKMKAALERAGIEVCMLSLAEGLLQRYVDYATKSPPLGLITFEERVSALHLHRLFDCHELFIAEHALTPIAHLLEEPHKIVALPDRGLARYAKGCFFPPSIGSRFSRATSPRPIKIASFASLMDSTWLHAAWRKLFPPAVFEAVISWSRLFQGRQEAHPLQQMLTLPKATIALCQGVSGHDLLLATIQYLQASKVRPLVESFRSLPIHLFGEHCGKDLYASLPNAENVHLHALPPYKHILSLLEEIEIVVMEPLESIDGPPDYFFQALQRGTLPLTPPSRYLIELFGQEPSFFYRNYEELLEKCHFYVSNPTERLLLLDRLRQMDRRLFSWESSAQRSVEILQSYR